VSTNHDKKTHDSLVQRVAAELEERYGYDVDTNVEYVHGEVDVARYDKNGQIIRYYEVKSNDLWCNYKKARKQTKRFINYQEGTIDIQEMDTMRRGIYISQDGIGGDIRAERTV